MNVFLRKDADDRRRQPERFRFPVARFNRRQIPLNGPFFHFMPQVPIFADRLTKQTLIFSVSGGVYILPPLVNTYGQLFSVAELIASGYASLVSSGSLPTGPINMLPFFNPTPLIGPNIPIFRPGQSGFRGSIRTKLESLSIPKDYYRSSNLHSTIEMDENDSEDNDGDEDDYEPPSRSYNRPPRRTTTAVATSTYSNTIAKVQKKLKEATVRFLNTIKQGICVEMILNATVRNQYISSNLIGRVQPVGTFLTTDTATEYLYGLLCAIPNLPLKSILIDTLDLLQWGFDPNYYRTFFKLQINLQSTKKITLLTMIAFDEQFKVCGYEAVVPNAGLTLDFAPEEYSFVISNLCQAIQITCPVGSSNQQYTDVNECISFLSEPQTPFGSYDRADQNNVVCRLIHIQLAAIAPAIHCPHVGKTGGGACTNKTSQSYFEGMSDFVSCAYQSQK
ncbi:unnamed protein product [Adineta ricciae]|uniref:Uncharacterized protein n=1 Tax=Adineta ricciae TaxID=249248 RepID=A0A815MSJ1_ADIRI|nr:unnamed protein product [Adineta ricciae]